VLPGAPTPGDTKPSRLRPWHKWTLGFSLLGLVIVLVASLVELPYYTISPGDALDLYPRITVEGAPTYETDGEMLLLFVRQNSRVTPWRWLRAALDPDVDLIREKEFRQGQTPEEISVDADADMARSQLWAKKVALETAGYEVPAAPGALIVAVLPSRPAAEVLRAGDVLLEVDGTAIPDPSALPRALEDREPGDTVPVRLRRDGKERTENVELSQGENGRAFFGVHVAQPYDFPIDVSIDTSNIGGPSAGLAMTLSVLDELTKGSLSGGQDIAVTGSIDPDGNVGEIGSINQKAVAARAAGADLFLVPKCTREELKAACEKDLQHAKDRAGDLAVVPVATLAEAVRALDAHGGDPVTVDG
jgi:PDZ domain-containing protein